MEREELQQATEELQQAAQLVDGEFQRRIREQSNQLGNLSTREEAPDHGRLDRHMHALREIAAELDQEPIDDEAEELVLSARELVSEYRTGVEGV